VAESQSDDIDADATTRRLDSRVPSVTRTLDGVDSIDDIYDDVTYERAALFYHALRLEIGDAAFFITLASSSNATCTARCSSMTSRPSPRRSPNRTSISSSPRGSANPRFPHSPSERSRDLVLLSVCDDDPSGLSASAHRGRAKHEPGRKVDAVSVLDATQPYVRVFGGAGGPVQSACT
jgi:hypothetical protein